MDETDAERSGPTTEALRQPNLSTGGNENSPDMFESPAKQGPPSCIVGLRFNHLYRTSCEGDTQPISRLSPKEQLSIRYHLEGTAPASTEHLCKSHLPLNLERLNVKKHRGCCGAFSNHESFRKKQKTINLEMCVKLEKERNIFVKPGFSFCKACVTESAKSTATDEVKPGVTEQDLNPGTLKDFVPFEQQESLKCFASKVDSKSYGEICDTHFTIVKEMSWEKREMLRFLVTCDIPEDAVLCDKHQPTKLQSITSWKRNNDFCANPFLFHEQRNQTKVRVNLSICRKIEKSNNVKLRLGQGLCSRCYDHSKTLKEPDRPPLPNLMVPKDEEEEELQASLTPPQLAVHDLNLLCKHIGVEPFGTKDRKPKQKLKQSRTKYEEIKAYVKSKFMRVLEMEESDDLSDNETEQKLNDFDKLLEDIKEKISKTSAFRYKVQLLTVVPLSWTVKDISSFFSVSKHAARVAKRLRRETGVLSMPGPRKVYTLPPETLKLVLEIYEDEDFARECPGTHVSIGDKKQVQKKLMLCTIDELYATFKERYPDVKVGRSKFYDLRPKWCAFPGSSGTHSICVCKYHENFRLCLAAVDFSEEETKKLLKEAMCGDASRECYLRMCEKCPSVENVRETVRNSVKKKMEPVEEDFSDFEEESDPEDIEESIRDVIVKYKQWVNTDRPDLLFVESSFGEFCEEVTKQLLNLLQHEFVTIQQAKHVKQEKATLSDFKIMALLDFAQNYTYTIQRETQSHYFNKGSLTVHPVILYFRENGETKHKSLCYISEDVTHDVAFVQSLLKHLTQYIKSTFPYVTEIEYVSDGCGGQYKNCKNFLLLCQHEKNFDLKASWSFFATSHGKSACDAVGGRVKLDVTQESLRRLKAKDKPINNIQEFFSFRKKKESAGSLITHFILKKEDVEKKRIELETLNPSQVQGTRSFHHFKPLTESIIGCKRVSSDEEFSLEFDLKKEQFENVDMVETNTYVACVIDKCWMPAFVTNVNVQEREIEAIILTPISGKKTRTFEWPEFSTPLTFPFIHVLTKIDVEIKQNGIMVSKMREVNKKLTLFLKQ